MGNKTITRWEEFPNGAIRVSKAEVNSGTGIAVEPADLTPAQRAEFGRIMGLLASEGLRHVLDPVKLADHCRENF